MKVYLCGPINGCTDEECKVWRHKMAEMGLDVIDPMQRDYRGREQECFREIVEGDKADIDECDVLLVNYFKPSVGTSMEILYAKERGKMVAVVDTSGKPLSPWLRYHADVIVEDFGLILGEI